MQVQAGGLDSFLCSKHKTCHVTKHLRYHGLDKAFIAIKPGFQGGAAIFGFWLKLQGVAISVKMIYAGGGAMSI